MAFLREAKSAVHDFDVVGGVFTKTPKVLGHLALVNGEWTAYNPGPCKLSEVWIGDYPTREEAIAAITG